ncbi:putative ATP-dependent helicase C29A10.10c [Bienertia sinuspersici]
MGSRGRPLFDLNETPPELDEGIDDSSGVQPQKVLPSLNSCTSDLLVSSVVPSSIVNNNAFSHASSVSGFQPFVKIKVSSSIERIDDKKMAKNLDSDNVLPEVSESSSRKGVTLLNSGTIFAPVIEKEEGEWSDGECSEPHVSEPVEEKSFASGKNNLSEQGAAALAANISPSRMSLKRNSRDSSPADPRKIQLDCSSSRIDSFPNDITVGTSQNLNGNAERYSMDLQGDLESVPKLKEVKGVEAIHALKSANSLGKHKLDEHKEAMLGKKRNRKTMFLNIEDAKQAGAVKSSTPKRQIVPIPSSTRMPKANRNLRLSAEHNGEKQNENVIRDQNQADLSSNEEPSSVELLDRKSESNNDMNTGLLARPRRLNSSSDLSVEGNNRHNLWKQSTDTRQFKDPQTHSRKQASSSHGPIDVKQANKKNPPKRPLVTNNQYQDTSVERLLREVTSEKFWHNPEESDLQCVPGRFESVEDYIRVFEPLLFEECRAQLYSTWEELSETTSRDAHVMVRVKSVERRERGWYDVIVLPANETKWTFKEGDVAVLSSPRPGSVRTRRNSISSVEEYEEPEGSARAVGTVRRHIPLDMQNAILKPTAEQFPKYEEQTPAIPECFTPNFVEHLHRTFNNPQLSAIQWAAMHTAAGTSNGVTKKQEPWPFTLVQGPPGTGKTHTVWGMLNVIHLVQYQHYYTALLKKLAPESYKQNNDRNADATSSGSIDEVLRSMDENLFRTLPKLCPKPRMLVCAPSNAATDELLSRVLDRGFIDGEMKVYRPDVARVGVDTQSRAAQAVSVERRTEQLLVKTREEIFGWLQQLRGREAHLSRQMTSLQVQLNSAAVSGRSQGSVGVDPDVLMARDQNRDAFLQNLAAVVEERDKVLVEMSRLLILEGKFRPGSNFNLEEARASLETSFANEAEIVFTTLSSSGRKLFSRLTHGFDMVVIDEAAQASEVGILPPLALGAARCVLVGDPQQLPATVISKAAGTLLYSRSLFERFQQAGCPTMLLSVQYRMHPQIRDFPSRYFYQGRLTDSETVLSLPDERYYQDPLLRPYVFFDITHGRESHRGGSVSYQNVHEAHFCLRLYEHLQKTVKSLGLGKVTVGIITPYKLQFKCLQREFEDVLNSEDGKDLYINTVDAFQGQERDVIIMSCVRASNHGVGFVADIRRMNVALTRARRALWVMGNANALIQSEDWAALITDAKSRKCYMDMDSLPKEFTITKGPPHNSFPIKFSSGARSSRPGGPRPRLYDMHPESKPGPVLDDETQKHFSNRKD